MTSRTIVRGNQRREQILTTAMEMFGELGYRGTSLRDIATRVGITHPGLLYHFHSKEELLQAVLTRRDDLNVAHFRLEATADPMHQVRGIIANIAFNTTVPGMIELFATLAAEATDPAHPAHEYFKRRYTLLTDSIEQVAAGLKAEGRLVDGVDAPLFAQEFVALMEGLQIQWLYHPDRVDMALVLARRLNEILAIDKLDEAADWTDLATVLAD